MQQKGKTITFTGVIEALHYSHEISITNYPKPTVNLSKYIGANSVPTVSPVFQPMYHMTNLNQVCLLSDKLRENEVHINSIGLMGYHKPISTDNEVYNEVEVFDLSNEAIVQHNNCQTLFKLDDIYKFQMYNILRAQMDGSAKCTVTNNINLLKNICMRGATSNNVIVPQTEGF